MNILLIEPYFTGSHASWSEELSRYSRHSIKILKMPGRYWKWRMHGGSVTVAKEFLNSNYEPDLILCSDMLDLSQFLGLTRHRTHAIPSVIYFHENQLTYPWSPDDRDILNNRDNHYSYINYSSALAADGNFFNSQYHMDSFISNLPNFLKQFPDHNELDTINIISKKSKVLPLGIDLSRFDQYRDLVVKKKPGSPPVIVWNHRWEYDKNPADFFNALYRLDEEDISFQLIILGEHFHRIPVEFSQAQSRLSHRIKHFGFVESFSQYAELLMQSDIIPITSNQDFFGISLAEALYCGSIPLLPRRLSYPELVPYSRFNDYFYNNNEEYFNKLKKIILYINTHDYKQFYDIIKIYDWKNMISAYDNEFEKLTLKNRDLNSNIFTIPLENKNS